ncbi:hypothetical protein [Phytohabitans suffuscus]|uniref:hypothetical protein n=1 Tax=Phytohabitans suffuscus TaxID=624315 RepID=UPI0038CD67BD
MYRVARVSGDRRTGAGQTDDLLWRVGAGSIRVGAAPPTRATRRSRSPTRSWPTRTTRSWPRCRCCPTPATCPARGSRRRSSTGTRPTSPAPAGCRRHRPADGRGFTSPPGPDPAAEVGLSARPGGPPAAAVPAESWGGPERIGPEDVTHARPRALSQRGPGGER